METKAEIEIVGVDINSVKLTRRDWTYFTRAELLELKDKLEENLNKVNMALAELP